MARPLLDAWRTAEHDQPTSATMENGPMTTGPTKGPERKAYLLHLTDGEYAALLHRAERQPIAQGSEAANAADALRYARPRSGEDLAEIGRGALQRDYYDACECIARDAVDEAIEQAREGLAADDPTDWDDVRERVDELIFEDVDGSSWVIYTASAMDVLRISYNDSAVEEVGIESCVGYSGINWSALAFYAMRADVMEYVEPMIETAEEAEDERIAALADEEEADA